MNDDLLLNCHVEWLERFPGVDDPVLMSGIVQGVFLETDEDAERFVIFLVYIIGPPDYFGGYSEVAAASTRRTGTAYPLIVGVVPTAAALNAPKPAPHNVYRDGYVHVCATECSTCIFRPDVRPVSGARLAGMVRETCDTDGATVVCHHTLDGDNAICRGWWDRLAASDTILRLAIVTDRVVEVPAP